MSYLLRVAIAADQFANAVRGGEPDETLSAAAHRLHLKGRSGWRNFINRIFFWQEDHCKDAYESEKNRKQLPKEYSK